MTYKTRLWGRERGQKRVRISRQMRIAEVWKGGICSQSDKFALIKGTKQKKKEVGRNVAHLEAVKQV